MYQSKKIAIDARALEGRPTGVGRYLSNLLKHFGNTEILEDVFGENPPTFYLYFKHAVPDLDILKSDVFIKRRLAPLLGRESNAAFTHILLPQALRKDRVDLFFAPSYVAPFSGASNLVLTLHDISYEAHPEWVRPADRILLRFASKWAAKRARHILVPSAFSKKEVMRLYRIPGDRITVVPLAADPVFAQIISPAEEKQTLEKFGVAAGKYLLFVGHIINRRHPIEMLEAFTAIGKEFPDLSLLFVGPDRTYPPLGIDNAIEQTNRTIGRGAVRHVTGTDDRELAALYRKASCLLWPSSYEGFGLPPLEALSLGTPVITTNATSLPGVVGDAALRLAEPLTASNLVDAIRCVLKDETLRAFLKKKAETQAKKFFWERTARETLGVFRQVLESNKVTE